MILDASSNVDYDKILSGVILDFIQLVIYPIDETAERKLQGYIRSKNADFNKIYSPSTNRNLIHIPFSASISKQLVQLLVQVPVLLNHTIFDLAQDKNREC